MAVMEWIRFIAGAAFLLIGMFIFLVEMIGVFKFKYVLNRMHAAAMGDTLGIGSCLLGLIIMCGFTFTSLKLLVVIIFLWFSSPVSSHLIARLEISTGEDSYKYFGRVAFDENSKEIPIEQAGNKETTAVTDAMRAQAGGALNGQGKEAAK